jgi:hypothetical protein
VLRHTRATRNRRGETRTPTPYDGARPSQSRASAVPPPGEGENQGMRRDGVEPPQSETPVLQTGGLASAQPTRCYSMSSPGIEPGLRPSQSRVRVRHTPRTTDRIAFTERPARESNPASRLRTPQCVHHTRRDPYCPRQESNLVRDLRKVVCRPSHYKGLIFNDSHRSNLRP